MAYTTDSDLVKIRPNILDLKVDSWYDMHVTAATIVDEILEMRWYRQEAVNREVNYNTSPFDGDKLNTTQIKRLVCYKVLELCYEYLMKGTAEPDGYERLMHMYQDRFDGELQRLLVLGIHYDWDADDELEQTEKFSRGVRRLARI